MINIYYYNIIMVFIISGIGYVNMDRRGGWNNWSGGTGGGTGGGHKGYVSYHQQPAHQTFVQRNSITCSYPIFTDEATFEVDRCVQNHRNPSCQYDRIPIQWKATMVCRKNHLVLKYQSICSQDGNWNPPFPNSCISLIEQNGYIPTNVHQMSTPTITSKMDCIQFEVQLTDNFMLNCIFPGIENEIENCFTHHKSVPSGTKLYLKCKLPYRSIDGHYPVWLCEDGNWPYEKSKLVCVYSTMNGHLTETEEQGVTNYYQSTPNPIYIPHTTIKTYYTSPSYEQIGLQTTRRPHHTSLISTQNTRVPIVIIPSSTLKSEKMCPALTHISRGVRLECVFLGQGVSSSKCNSPMPKGSEAKYSCGEYHESNFGLKILFRKCKEDGSWTGNADSFMCLPQCGQANVIRIPYITNGLPTVRGQWPWHVAIFLHMERTNQWNFICGGTLITKKAVITAAHCVTLFQTTETREITKFRIDLGKYERETNDDLVQERSVRELQVNPSYNPYGYDSDIAIIILKSEVEIGYHVRPICFPQTSDTALEEVQLSENSIGTVLGWGYDETRQLSTHLRMAKLKVVGRRECSQSIEGDSSSQIHTRSTTYCAGFHNGTNVCNGDSGGGMYFNSKESNDITRWYLQGIVSVGIADEDGKCDPTQYSIFTRVGRYSDWITRVLTESEAT